MERYYTVHTHSLTLSCAGAAESLSHLSTSHIIRPIMIIIKGIKQMSDCFATLLLLRGYSKSDG